MKILRDLFKDYRFAVSFCILAVLVFMALLSFFSPYDPTLWHVVPRDLKPSLDHLLGTDSNGQDIFWWLAAQLTDHRPHRHLILACRRHPGRNDLRVQGV
jgi:hypothetical protein